MSRRGILIAIAALTSCFLLAGCAEIVKTGTAIGQSAGYITLADKERYDRMAEQTESAARPITDREEYYVGRAVAATILGHYRLYHNEQLTRYLNQIGQSVAMASDRPITFRGYHFAILDSEEVNALACPGGIVFITKGMLRRAANEEELAAILAHEIAHVNHKDGLGAIKQSRWVEVVATIGAEATRELSDGQVAKLTSLFEGSVNDVAKTLIVNGYSRKQEMAADESAMIFMHRLGYDPHGLTDYLATLAREQDRGAARGFYSTHPGMTARLLKAKSFLTDHGWQRLDHRIRDQRFNNFQRAL
jgi:predicted Zn-dependent protease